MPSSLADHEEHRRHHDPVLAAIELTGLAAPVIAWWAVWFASE
jgi:hypothetical protein